MPAIKPHTQLDGTTMLIDDDAPAPRIWFPPASTSGSVIEDSEVARNNKTDEDLERPRMINEVCVNLYIWIPKC